MSTPKRTVTTNQLQDEAIEMIISQCVVEIMESYGFNPDDKSGQDMLGVSNAIFANKYGLMCNPMSDLHNLFKGFDSHWHNDDINQKTFTYRGSDAPNGAVTEAQGTEINYYFQGVLFRIFGYSKFTGLEWVQTWKFGSGHGAVTPEIQFFFTKGWQELPGFWRRALTEQRRRVANGVKADIRRRQRKARRA